VVFLQDGQAMLWDLNEGKHLYTLDGGSIINALTFSPNRYWLCAATGPSIKIWVCLTFPWCWVAFMWVRSCSDKCNGCDDMLLGGGV